MEQLRQECYLLGLPTLSQIKQFVERPLLTQTHADQTVQMLRWAAKNMDFNLQ